MHYAYVKKLSYGTHVMRIVW